MPAVRVQQVVSDILPREHEVLKQLIYKSYKSVPKLIEYKGKSQGPGDFILEKFIRYLAWEKAPEEPIDGTTFPKLLMLLQALGSVPCSVPLTSQF